MVDELTLLGLGGDAGHLATAATSGSSGDDPTAPHPAPYVESAGQTALIAQTAAGQTALIGPTAIVVGGRNSPGVAKVLKQFFKEKQKVSVKAGVLSRKLITP